MVIDVRFEKEKETAKDLLGFTKTKVGHSSFCRQKY
jgi:hypothetical protein